MTNISLAERRNWIGGSEVAGLLGLSPYTSAFQLYHEKRGAVAAADLDDNERIMAGRHLEPAIAGWANEKWGWDLAKVTEYIPHPTVRQFGCSLDFRTGDGLPVEIKNQDGGIFRERWVTEGDEVIDAPAYFLIQLQAQMACTGVEAGWLLACAGGNRLYRMRVARHDRLIARLEQAVDDFWADVRDGVEPPFDPESDLDTLSILYASSRGAMLDLSGDNELPAACAGYLKAKEEEKAAKARVDLWKGVITQAIGAAPGAKIKGFTATFTDVPASVVPASTRRAHRRLTIRED